MIHSKERTIAPMLCRCQRTRAVDPLRMTHIQTFNFKFSMPDFHVKSSRWRVQESFIIDEDSPILPHHHAGHRHIHCWWPVLSAAAAPPVGVFGRSKVACSKVKTPELSVSSASKFCCKSSMARTDNFPCRSSCKTM